MEYRENMKTATKKITIITINYNDVSGMRKTAESIVSQEWYEFIEWIVIDGGSTDGSVELIRSYENKISYWISEKDNGIYHAMNKGIIQARGDYVIFRNSGDMMSSNDVVKRFLQHSAYGKYDHCAGISEDFRDGIWYKNWYPFSSIGIQTFFRSAIAHHAVFTKRERFINELYDETMKIGADMKFFMKDFLINNASYAVLDFPVCKFSIGGISCRNIELGTKEHERARKELLPTFIYNELKKIFSGNKKHEQILINTIYARTWEFRVLAYFAWLLCLPRRCILKMVRLVEIVMKRPCRKFRRWVKHHQ